MAKPVVGATGKFPEGKIGENDEGELCIGVCYDDANDIVRIDFGKPVAWLGFPPSQAVQFARIILMHAEKFARAPK